MVSHGRKRGKPAKGDDRARQSIGLRNREKASNPIGLELQARGNRTSIAPSFRCIAASRGYIPDSIREAVFWAPTTGRRNMAA
jgi:hypothetical protein